MVKRVQIPPGPSVNSNVTVHELETKHDFRVNGYSGALNEKLLLCEKNVNGLS